MENNIIDSELLKIAEILDEIESSTKQITRCYNFGCPAFAINKINKIRARLGICKNES